VVGSPHHEWKNGIRRLRRKNRYCFRNAEPEVRKRTLGLHIKRPLALSEELRGAGIGPLLADHLAKLLCHIEGTRYRSSKRREVFPNVTATR
jgi:hypothetical protein